MSILKWQVNSSSDFWSFFSAITYNSCKFVAHEFSTKGSNENINFEISKRSDENLLNSSCYFPNHKSVFFQILYDSSVSWNILLCPFLGQTLHTLHKRDQWKCKDFLMLKSKFTKFLSYLKQNKFLFQFCATLIVCIGISTPPCRSKTTPLSCQPPS